MLEIQFYKSLLKDNVIQPISGTGNIYYHNIIQARTEALLDIFPAVTACLSEDYIRFIAQDYCRQYDALHGNLNLYGNNFGQYLAEIPECTKYPFIRDLADFEYAIQCLLYCRDENHLSLNDFMQAVQNEKSPVLSKVTLGFNSCYAVTDIADFCLQKTDIQPNITENLFYYFLYRDIKTQKIFIKSITASEMEIIPILKTRGILGLSEDMLNHSTVSIFLNFLTTQNLWIL